MPVVFATLRFSWRGGSKIKSNYSHLLSYISEIRHVLQESAVGNGPGYLLTHITLGTA